MEKSENKRRSMATYSEPSACHLCGRIFFDNVSLAFHFETHHENEPNTQGQNMGQSENKRTPVVHSMPIACRVCDKIFFDNVSLVLHFECHLKKEIPNPRQHISTMASLQRDSPVSLNSLQAASSSEERVSVTHRNKIPRMTDHSRPCAFSVWSSKSPNMSLRDAGSVQAPVPDLNLPLSSSFDAQWGTSHSSFHSTLSYPLFKTPLVAYWVDCNLAAVPSNKQTGGEKSPVKQLEEPREEIIVISDDEEDGHKSNVEMLDLTLKL